MCAQVNTHTCTLACDNARTRAAPTRVHTHLSPVRVVQTHAPHPPACTHLRAHASVHTHTDTNTAELTEPPNAPSAHSSPWQFSRSVHSRSQRALSCFGCLARGGHCTPPKRTHSLSSTSWELEVKAQRGQETGLKSLRTFVPGALEELWGSGELVLGAFPEEVCFHE